MKIKDLPPRQQAVMRYIEKRCDTHYPPTLREIGDKFGITSPRGVTQHLDALEKKGFIIREFGVSRGIRLSPEYRKRGIPLLSIKLLHGEMK